MAEVAPIVATAVDRTYALGANVVRSLVGISMEVGVGEVVAVLGPSGSGKSTLLYLLGGLDDPDGGRIRITGVDWRSLSPPARARFRRERCGFVAQGRTLLPQATAAENVEVPLLLHAVPADDRRRRVVDALRRVGLSSAADKLPDQLSGGEQQRVSIARALVNRPAVVLADEPTASLDSSAAQDVTKLLVSAATEGGAAVVLVTHDPAVAVHATRTVRLSSGRVVEPNQEGDGP